MDLFCDFVGSGGTFSGTSQYLKEVNPSVKCFIVEPQSAPILATGTITRSGHKVIVSNIRLEQVYNCFTQIQGGGYSMDKETLTLLDDMKTVDGFLQVSDEEVIQTCQLLAQKEGIFSGFSAGANVLGATHLLRRKEHQGKTVVVLLCDSGMKYLSTDLWGN